MKLNHKFFFHCSRIFDYLMCVEMFYLLIQDSLFPTPPQKKSGNENKVEMWIMH